MSFQCRYGCGTWCIVDPSIKTNTGKLIPLNTITHEPHECHLSPYFHAKSSKVRAKAIQIQEIQKIDDYALIQQTQEQIKHLNTRLANYRFVLMVEPKQKESSE
jgi:hypothetical protein